MAASPGLALKLAHQRYASSGARSALASARRKFSSSARLIVDSPHHAADRFGEPISRDTLTSLPLAFGRSERRKIQPGRVEHLSALRLAPLLGFGGRSDVTANIGEIQNASVSRDLILERVRS
jgi:hypothetical protein